MSKIVIDFQVFDSNDPEKIIILDTSIWSFIESKPAVIEIITPGESKAVGYPYTKNGVTILNSVNLGLNCVDCGKNEFYDLPDGIYEITVKGSPDKFSITKMYLKTTTLRNNLDDIITAHYSDCKSCSEQSDDIGKILRYKNLIEVAEAFVRRGYKCEAQDIIYKIHDYVKKFKKCKKCPHKL